MAAGSLQFLRLVDDLLVAGAGWPALLIGDFKWLAEWAPFACAGMPAPEGGLKAWLDVAAAALEQWS
eukprot:835693-Lingulodinium_polyedra.AAC.1